MKKSLSLVAAIAILNGCVSAGSATLKNVTNETLTEELTEGMTMAEVRSALGDPMDVSYTDGGLSIWNYERIEAQMTAESFIPIVSLFSSGVEGTKTQLVILFDEDDKVRKFTFSDSAYESKSGMMSQ